jgi:hypothetical protein
MLAIPWPWIPKIIHVSWWQGRGHMPEQYTEHLDLWQRLNPEWSIRFWSADDLDRLVRNSRWRRKWDQIPLIKGDFPHIKKADFARYVVLYHYGGLYSDLDIVPVRPIWELFEETRVHCDGVYRFDLLTDEDCERVRDLSKPIGEHKLIFFEECRSIDSFGPGIANGLMFSRPGLRFWRHFLTYAWKFRDRPTLQAFGPHRLAYFLRMVRSAYQEDYKGLSLPCYYGLFNRRIFGPIRHFTFALHESECSWGSDETPKRWMA